MYEKAETDCLRWHMINMFFFFAFAFINKEICKFVKKLLIAVTETT